MEILLRIKKVYIVSFFNYIIRYVFPTMIFGQRKCVERDFKKRLGYWPNLDNPESLNEKMNWLKINDHRKMCSIVADKYRVREIYSKYFGEQYVVPLVAKLDSWKQVSLDMIPDYPVIIKSNNGSGTWKIIRKKNEVEINKLRYLCRSWMKINPYYLSHEWQYKNIKPCIMIEKLLLDQNGKIPADIKLHYFNGELQFIYKVIDREGDAYRAFFTPDWELLPFQYVSPGKHSDIRMDIKEKPPICLDKMIEFGNRIAKHFKYVRVDYYDLGEKFYFSEITLYHGGGFNRFYPEKYEKFYSDKLNVK